MSNSGMTNEDLYALIAGRLVWDRQFHTMLLEKPRQALHDTLAQAGVDPMGELLDSLEAELEQFISEQGSHKIMSSSMMYLGSKPKPDVV